MTPDSIEFIPPSSQKNVLCKINELIAQSIEIKGLISYWTISHKILHYTFPEKIKGKGFIAVDIHFPTNIDALLELASTGSNVLLHLYKVTGSSEFKGTQKLPSYLMHSKIFFFKLNKEKAAIWIGSHNATNRALQGKNIESSVLITTSLESHFCKSVSNFLDEVKSRCDKINYSLGDYYKWLQGQSNDRKIIDFLDENGIAKEGLIFALFVADPADAKGLKLVGDEILLSFTDNQNNRTFFSATIGQSGILTGYPKLGFTTKHSAYRYSKKTPILKEELIDDFHEIFNEENTGYFAVFTLKEKMTNTQRFITPIKSRWEKGEQQTVDLPDLENKNDLNQKSYITIKKAVSSDVFEAHRYYHSFDNITDNRPLVNRVTEIVSDEYA